MSKVDTTVGKLVEMIRGGELRLPEMQRRYVWPATRVRDLLDSLYRGYPSGTILVWETEQEMPTRDLAVEQKVSPFHGHKLLLDGQQRLTSLTAVIAGEPVSVRNRKKPVEILFNLEHPEGPPVDVLEVDDDSTDVTDEETDEDEDENGAGPSVQERLRSRTFVVASSALEADPRWISVSEIFRGDRGDSQLLRGLVKSFDDPLFDKYTKRLQRVRAIRDYPYVMHVLDKDLSYEEVAEIFVRVNSLGVKLRGSDLALAQITSRWRDSLKLFEAFQEECEKYWFTLELGLIVRSLVVYATGQSRFKTTGTLPVERLKKAWEAAKEGLRFAIDFLKSNAGIEDETLLSSPLFLIAIAYCASRRGFQLPASEEIALKKWLFVANARGHYTRGSSETILDADLASMTRGGGATALTELLRQQIGRLEVEPTDFVGRGQRSALFPMAYLALKSRGAKDWRTRLGLSLTHQGKMHFIQHHHIFPKALLKERYETAEINEIANMAFISGGTNRRISARPPNQYLAEISTEQGVEALESHCIPTNPQLWEVENYRAFLAHRREALAQAINDFIAGSEKDAFQVLDVENLITSGESERVEFKSSARWDYKEGKPNKALEHVVAKTVAAFLNSKGGVLLIGVGDEGQVVGLERDFSTFSKKADRDGYQQFLVNLLSNTLGKENCALLTISFKPVQGHDVCAVEAQASAKPVYLKVEQGSRFYVRAASTTQEMDVQQAHEYIRARFRWVRDHADRH